VLFNTLVLEKLAAALVASMVVLKIPFGPARGFETVAAIAGVAANAKSDTTTSPIALRAIVDAEPCADK
jgi:hypothetical protein